MVFNNILEAIGNTPLIRLNKICFKDSADIFVKYEAMNVGGSIKVRPAYNMILSAQKKGLLNKNSIIVEPTSGNQGISLALVGAVFGYKVKVIMPDSVSVERRKLIEQYGAEVILIKDKGDIGECISACKEMSEKMQKENKNIFVPGQFENIANVETHRNYAAIEILEQIDRPIHGFCSGIGAGPRYCSKYRTSKGHYYTGLAHYKIHLLLVIYLVVSNVTKIALSGKSYG